MLCPVSVLDGPCAKRPACPGAAGTGPMNMIAIERLSEPTLGWLRSSAAVAAWNRHGAGTWFRLSPGPTLISLLTWKCICGGALLVGMVKPTRYLTIA